MRKSFVVILAIGLLISLILSGYKEASSAPVTPLPSAPNPAPVPPGKKLPPILIFLGGRVGSVGHATTVGFAEAIKRKAGITVKVIPAGSDMARFIPLKTGEAQASMLGSSHNFTMGVGLGDLFGDEAWGPQPLRVLWQGSVRTGVYTTKDKGIRSLKDLKGKRLPNFQDLALRVQWAGIFAATGITWEDVKSVPAVGVVDTAAMVNDGTIDASFMTTTSALMYELEAKKGLVWLEAPKDPEAIKRLLGAAPFFVPGWIYGPGAGINKGERVWGFDMPFNLMCWNSLDREIAYTITKAIWEGYDIYKDLHPELKEWDQKTMLQFWRLAEPYHDGTVRLLKEKGVWTSEMEERQKITITKQEARAEAWPEAQKAAAKAKISLTSSKWYDPVTGFWIRWVKDHDLLVLPEVR